jgi:hypothetical protein
MKPPPHSLTLTPGPSAGNALGRVIAIAPAPLLMGEDEADYAEIAGRIVGATAPRDALEELLLRDVIDLTWEILRLRRVKVGMLRASMGAGVGAVLGAISYPYPHRETLGEDWTAGDADAREEVDAILGKAGLTIEEATAKTLELKIDVFERIDRMLASAEARRNNALREIDRHREAAGTAARKALDQVENVEDAEFRDLETGETSGAPAA